MNALLIFTAACIACFVAEFSELDVDEGSGVLERNGLYTVFAVGFIFSIFCLIAAIIEVRKESEGILSFSRVVNLITTVLMFFSTVVCIAVFCNPDIDWTADSDRRGTLAVGLAASILAVVLSVVVFLFCNKGLKYYDRGKKLAKDVPQMEEDRPARVHTGFSFFCIAILNTSLAFLALYYAKSIQYFDETMIEHNEGFQRFYFILFIIGLLITLDTVFVGILDVTVQKKDLRLINKAAVIENLAYLLVFVIAGIITMSQQFVKDQCPDIAYIIFSFLLAACELGYLLANFRRIRKFKVSDEKKEI
jgi:putative effector of murein hydrolase LrgA (UPF0299 family)